VRETFQLYWYSKSPEGGGGGGGSGNGGGGGRGEEEVLVQASSLDCSAPEVIDRTNRLLQMYSDGSLQCEDDALVAIHKGVDPNATDKVSSLLVCVKPSHASL
jgi:hypothetical protein